MVGHVLISSHLDVVNVLLEMAITYRFSTGLVPYETQKDLINTLDLPKKMDAIIELALRYDARFIDLIKCNGIIMLYKATVGWLPLLDASSERKFVSLNRTLIKLDRLKPFGFVVTTASKEKVRIVATGCMIIQHQKGGIAAKFIGHDNSVTDGMISLIITSPFSKIQYLISDQCIQVQW